MKASIVLAGALALAACGQRADTAAEGTPSPTDTAMTGAASPMATTAATQAATGNMAGRYEVTMADGKTMTETINADGTYVDVMAGKETRGRWRMDGTRSCFDAEGAEAERCYTTSTPGADGSFTITGADGTRSTVRKVGAAPAAN